MITAATALLSLSMLSVTCVQADHDQGSKERIQRLVRDLGSERSKTRDEAVRELKAIGNPAIPYLKEAARSDDLERAMLARHLLMDLAGRPPAGKEGQPSPLGSGVSVTFHDWARCVRFLRHADGRVELTVPEKDDTSGNGKRKLKTYRAESLEEFKSKFPEVAKQYDLENLMKPPTLSEDQRKVLRDLKERFGLGEDDSRQTPPWPSEDDFASYDDLMRWIREQEQRLQSFVERWEDSRRGQDGKGPKEGKKDKGRGFGVLLSPADPALRAQLGLADAPSFVIHQVQEGSLAGKSGLKRYDVLVKLNGKPVGEFEQFRRDLESALESKGFTLEILRDSKPLSITVTPQKEER